MSKTQKSTWDWVTSVGSSTQGLASVGFGHLYNTGEAMVPKDIEQMLFAGK